MPQDLDSNVFPLAYLITFRTYGTWLHGDPRGSVDRKTNIYGTPLLHPDHERKRNEEVQLKSLPIILTSTQRKIVERAARNVCYHRGYALLAINVRPNHVHAVISAACKPERVLEALKAYATRELRQTGSISADLKPWVRHGSTRYLWKEQQLEKAMTYVLYGQGDDPPDFND
jgi:REP element-mobilizing transposase RayT